MRVLVILILCISCQTQDMGPRQPTIKEVRKARCDAIETEKNKCPDVYFKRCLSMDTRIPKVHDRNGLAGYNISSKWQWYCQTHFKCDSKVENQF